MRLNELAERESLGRTTLARARAATRRRGAPESSRFRASWRRPRSSSGSTWAPSTSSSRSRARSRSHAACSASGEQGTTSSPFTRPHLPKFRADLLESASRGTGDAQGAIEARPTEPARRPRPADRGGLRRRRGLGGRPARARPSRVSVLRPLSRPARERPRHVGGPLPVRRVRRAPPARRLGSNGGVVRGRAGARQLAVTNAGTIPDRGLFGVHLVDGGGQVGELDEEMVYEPGRSDVSPRRLDLADRGHHTLTVSWFPLRPACPGSLFWKGEGVSRPAELGRRSAVPRELGSEQRRGFAAARARVRPRCACCEEPHDVSARAEAATGVVPSDRAVVVERFRDEIGDWRVCVLTPFGGRVHAPWSMALAAPAARLARRRCRRLVKRRHPRSTFPTRISRLRSPTSARPGRGRRARPPGTRSRRSSARVARPLRGRSSSRAAVPAADAALAAASEGAKPAPGRPPPTSSRSCSRPIANACRTSSTCPPLPGPEGVQTRGSTSSK